MIKFPTVLALLLCIALYAIQVVTPCVSCYTSEMDSSCSVESCHSCCDSSEELPCECQLEEMPLDLVFLESSSAEDSQKQPLVKGEKCVLCHVARVPELLFSGSHTEIPPPKRSVVRAQCQVFKL